MEDGNVQNGTTDQNVEIKEEPKDQSPWSIAGETINLISDDEQDEEADAGFSAVAMDVEPAVEQSDGATPAEITENVTSGPNQDQVMALQNMFANKFRERKKQEAKQNAPSLRSKEDESDEDDSAAGFQQAKKIYEKKKRSNTLTMEDEIEFMRRESLEMARVRKQQADAEFDRTPSADDERGGLFVSDGEEPAAPRLSELLSEAEPATPKKRGRRANTHDNEPQAPKKRAKKGMKVLGADYTEDDFDTVLQRARQTTAIKKAKPKVTAKPKKAVSSKAKPRSGRAPATQMTNLGSLLGNDVFGDAEATANLPAQPAFFGQTRRNDAMKELIASVPGESMHIGKSDKKYLDDAIKSFTGHASVKPNQDGNGWDVKGMKSSLKHYQVLGTAFMRRRENDAHLPKGGILVCCPYSMICVPHKR